MGVISAVSTIASATYEMGKIGGIAKTINNVMDGIVSVTDLWADGLSVALDSWGKLDNKMAQYGRTIGATRGELDKLRREIIHKNYDAQITLKYGVNDEKLVEYISNFKNALGRDIAIGVKDNLETIAATSKIIGEESAQTLLTNLNEVGISVGKSADYTFRMYESARKSGLSLSKYTKNVADNIKLASKYSFAEGIKGLEKMVKSSMSLNMQITNATNVAEKVLGSNDMLSTAVQMGSALQSLGGNFAAFSDPMLLLSNSIHDVNGIQGMIDGVLSDLAMFNKDNGKVELNDTDKLILRQAANTMGINYDELINGAQRKGIKEITERQMDENGIKNSQVRELLGNIAVLEDGIAKIEHNGELIGLDEVAGNDELMAELEKQYRFDGKTSEEKLASIAVDVNGIAELLENYKNFRSVQNDIIMEGKNDGKGPGTKIKGYFQTREGSNIYGKRYEAGDADVSRKLQNILGTREAILGIGDRAVAGAAQGIFELYGMGNLLDAPDTLGNIVSSTYEMIKSGNFSLEGILNILKNWFFRTAERTGGSFERAIDVADLPDFNFNIQEFLTNGWEKITNAIKDGISKITDSIKGLANGNSGQNSIGGFLSEPAVSGRVFGFNEDLYQASAGEYIINASSTARHRNLISAINSNDDNSIIESLVSDGTLRISKKSGDAADISANTYTPVNSNVTTTERNTINGGSIDVNVNFGNGRIELYTRDSNLGSIDLANAIKRDPGVFERFVIEAVLSNFSAQRVLENNTTNGLV